MNLLSRGIRNAFRNSVRTISIVLILGLAIGLSLVMLIAHSAVNNKINSVKSSVANTVTISPAGFSGFSQVNNALTSQQLSKVQAIAHVTNVNQTLTDRLTTIGSSSPFGNFGDGSSSSNNQTSLFSPVTINTNGGGGRFFISGGGGLPTNFSPPITIIGTNDPSEIDGSSLSLSSGQFIGGSSNTNNALLSSSMASKNNLKVGSNFTAYGATLTIAGIFNQSTDEAAGNDVIVSLPTEQSLSGQAGAVTSAVVTVDSIDNLNSVTNAIKSALGSSADVTNSVEQADNAVQPLNNIKTVAVYSLIGAVIAGGVILLLVMIMIVRERRREIGVLKAIGASNLRIMGQFMVESVTFTLLGAIVGIIFGFFAGNPLTQLLVKNASTSASTTSAFRGAGGGGFFRDGGGGPAGIVRSSGLGNPFRGLRGGFSHITTTVGWAILIEGLVAAVIIALIGSAVASLLIAKVRPAEVMRVE